MENKLKTIKEEIITIRKIIFRQKKFIFTPHMVSSLKELKYLEKTE